MDSSACASRLEKGERGAAELQANITTPWLQYDEWSITVLTALADGMLTTSTLHHSCAAVVPATPPLVDATLRRRRCDETAEDAKRNLDVGVAFRFADANDNNLFIPGQRR
jgi:hypothetical protein